jgi:hypothetical protein
MSARQRPAWVGWIPAGILALAILGTGVTAAVLVGNGLGQPAPKPTSGQVTDLNWSSFTPEGLDYIASSQKIRIDLSRPPAEAAPLGLSDTGVIVFDPVDQLDTELYYDLIVNGAGEYPGGIRITAAHVEVETSGGVVVAVRGVLADAFSFRDALALLEKEAPVYGWTYDRDAIFADVEDAVRADRDYEVAFEPASRVGVAVGATISCSIEGYCSVEYEMTPSVR